MKIIFGAAFFVSFCWGNVPTFAFSVVAIKTSFAFQQRQERFYVLMILSVVLFLFIGQLNSPRS